MMTTLKTIIAYEFVDHGIEHEQYFQGCGLSFTSYTDVVTGTGSSLHALSRTIGTFLIEEIYMIKHTAGPWIIYQAPYSDQMQVRDDAYVKIAQDHLGAACRDNSRSELIDIGKRIDNGTWDETD